jgi:hypothetical protein
MCISFDCIGSIESITLPITKIALSQSAPARIDVAETTAPRPYESRETAAQKKVNDGTKSYLLGVVIHCVVFGAARQY